MNSFDPIASQLANPGQVQGQDQGHLIRMKLHPKLHPGEIDPDLDRHNDP